MHNSGNNFIFKKPPTYLPKSAALLFHCEQIKAQNSGKDFDFCQISQKNQISAWNNTSLENGNINTQSPSSCNHQSNFENSSSLRRIPSICMHELFDHSQISQNPYLIGSTFALPHTHEDHAFINNYLAKSPSSFHPLIRYPHYSNPPPYANIRKTAEILRIQAPSGNSPIISHPHQIRQAQVRRAGVESKEAILTEKEIDRLVSEIAEEANSHVFVSSGPEEIELSIDESERENTANAGGLQEPRPRRLRKQTKPQCSAKRHDPNFKGVVVEMHIIVEGNKCQMRMHSSLGVKMGSLRLANDVRHILRRSCCSSDEQSNANRRFAPRPQPKNGTMRCVKECQSCGSRKTQLWRSSENGKLLCNICGTRFNKYRIRCSRCWHVPRQYGKLQSRCGCCGSSLCYVISKQRMIRCSA